MKLLLPTYSLLCSDLIKQQFMYKMLEKLITYVAEAIENCLLLLEEEAEVRFHFLAWQPEARRDLGSPSGSPRPLRVSRSLDFYRPAETNMIWFERYVLLFVRVHLTLIRWSRAKEIIWNIAKHLFLRRLKFKAQRVSPKISTYKMSH